ncbi:MAG: DUF3604 domain-containing protein [Alphaproteobacteria bacterium]
MNAAEPDFALLEAAVPENPLRDAYFGETHVHTSYSLDAYIGGARLTPDDSYRFAKGEDVMPNGQRHNILRPLDFAAVTDHAEYLGEMFTTQVPGAPGHGDPKVAELRELRTIEDRERWFIEEFQANQRSGKPGQMSFYKGPRTAASAWRDVIIKAANDHYRPGRFTTLIGYEWTSVVKGGNMHRNVLFRDARVPGLPFTAIDSSDEEKLWAWMAEQEARGSRLFAIPHNSNASKGLMFEPVDNAGRRLTREYAERRSKWEPLIEMMQVKGNSEVVGSLWPSDEFADFENAPSIQNFNGRAFKKESFVRWAVIKGLAYQSSIGANPWKLGFAGGTDNHNGAAGDVVESNAAGTHGGADDSVERRRTGEVGGWIVNREANLGALTGVWATRNTRSAIWDAMAARETFATSGTRIKLRFFGGASLRRPATPRAMVEQGYKLGVPMGGTLRRMDRPPTFTVWASKDPNGANLDRIQIIKGWVDVNGNAQERIIDVAWSGKRKRGPNGRVGPVGNTVDLTTARYRNSIGAPVLMGSWTDRSWKPGENAVYYARVLEIPTARWTTYDAVKHGLPLLTDVPASIQERAWASPIWYVAGG